MILRGSPEPVHTDDSAVALLSAADDALHPPAGSRWAHETVWFWFAVPDAMLAGWLYAWVRPNIGVSGGGCWLWDEHSSSHLDAPYYSNLTNLPLPEEPALGSLRFPCGLSIDTLEPLRSYHVSYADRDLIDVRLRFDATMAPWVPPGSTIAHHLDQPGRVHGTVVLHGERVDVDCLAIRDRSWTTRPEHWREGQVGYANATAPRVAFLATGAQAIVGGYYVRDGVRSALVDGERRVERDPQAGFVTEVEIRARDRLGRRLVASGSSVSRMAMPVPGVQGVAWTSLVAWTIDGEPAWGDDQDAWPLAAWSRARRRQTWCDVG